MIFCLTSSDYVLVNIIILCYTIKILILKAYVLINRKYHILNKIYHTMLVHLFLTSLYLLGTNSTDLIDINNDRHHHIDRIIELEQKKIAAKEAECQELIRKIQYVIDNPTNENEYVENINVWWWKEIRHPRTYHYDCQSVNNFINNHNLSKSPIKIERIDKNNRYVKRMKTKVDLNNKTITYTFSE